MRTTKLMLIAGIAMTGGSLIAQQTQSVEKVIITQGKVNDISYKNLKPGQVQVFFTHPKFPGITLSAVITDMSFKKDSVKQVKESLIKYIFPENEIRFVGFVFPSDTPEAQFPEKK